MSIIPLWAKALILTTFLTSLIGFGWAGGSSHKQKEWNLAKAAQIQAQLKESEHARQTETALQLKVQEAQNAREAESVKNRRIAAGLRAERDGLRDEIAAFASGSTSDTGDACRERATSLGILLEGALRTSEECANSAETLSGDVRSLRSAWPVIKGK